LHMAHGSYPSPPRKKTFPPPEALPPDYKYAFEFPFRVKISCYPCLWQSSYLSFLYSRNQSSWCSLRSTTNFSWACSLPWDLSSLDMISESLLKCTSPNIPRSLFCTDHNAALHPNPSLNSSTIQPALKRKQLPQNQ
jgi:hypothetical protein